jgi:hypothetical protein
MSIVQDQPSVMAPESSQNEKADFNISSGASASEQEAKDLNSRRKTGSIITIVGSALANLSDGYQQSLASSTNVIFNHIIGTKIYTSDMQTRISNSLLVGSVIGIVFFGYFADKFSRTGGSMYLSPPPTT